MERPFDKWTGPGGLWGVNSYSTPQKRLELEFVPHRFVLGRSGLHHSANYPSVMVFGKPKRIRGREEKLDRLEAFLEN